MYIPESGASRPPERVFTDIPGFDELCGGGLLKRRTYLVTGTSGTGKTVFGLQYLYNGITKYGENGIYITADETPLHAKENALQFGWDLKALEEEGKLAMIDARFLMDTESNDEKSIDGGNDYIRYILDSISGIKEDINAKRAFFCGAASIGFHFNDPSKFKTGMMRLNNILELNGLTSLISFETTDGNSANGFGAETLVTEGTIMISYKRIDRVRVRYIEIVRMKGSSHSLTFHPMEITSDGIIVHPHEEIYAMSCN